MGEEVGNFGKVRSPATTGLQVGGWVELEEGYIRLGMRGIQALGETDADGRKDAAAKGSQSRPKCACFVGGEERTKLRRRRGTRTVACLKRGTGKTGKEGRGKECVISTN